MIDAAAREGDQRAPHMKATSADIDWAVLEQLLPTRFQELAKEYRIIQPVPAQLGGKITSVVVLLRLILFHVALSVSLKVSCAAAAAAGIVDISPVALHLRMRKAGPYLAALVAEMAGTREKFAPEKWAGYDIRVLDATTVIRPGAKGTTARVHYSLRLVDLGVVDLDVTDETGGETFRRFQAEPGQLWLGDRCYANPPGVAHVTDAGADVLVRYSFGSLPLYDGKGVALDVEKKLQALSKEGQSHEWAAYVHSKDHAPIKGRLLAVRLPADAAADARERLRRELGSDASDRALRTAAFVILFTTVPKARMARKLVFELYRLRWQVELHIKRDKSIAGLDRLPNFRSDTIQSWICAKLLAQQLASKISTPRVDFSPSAVGEIAGHFSPSSRG